MCVKDSFETNMIITEELQTMDYHQLIKTVSSVWGLGLWSAEMTAIFYFGHEDVWSYKDAALQRGLRYICEENITKHNVLLNHFSPYKTFLSLHLWKAIDTKLIK